MGSPYLNSGETIVLTTNRVSADAVVYDIMLTTERLFLIDNQTARFEPRIIPLSAILSVQGGKTPAYEPVITLLFRTVREGIPRQPLNLVFSQNPSENRKNERDDWMRSLIKLSIARQERETAAMAPVVPVITGDTGLRPAVRHWVAPEKVRPLSNVVGHQAAPVPLVVIPEDAGGGKEDPAGTTVITPVSGERPASEPVPEMTATVLSPPQGRAPEIATPPVRVVIPQIIEELLPVRTKTAPPVEQVQKTETESDQEKLHHSDQMTILSLTSRGEPVPEPPAVQETLTIPEPVPEVEKQPEQPVIVPAHAAYEVQERTVPEPSRTDYPPMVETAPEQPPFIPHDAYGEQQEGKEITGEVHTGSEEPGTTVLTDVPEPVPEPALDIPQESIYRISGSQIISDIPANDQKESAGHPAMDTVLRREPAVAEPPQIRHPIPPATEIRPLITTLIYPVVMLVLIALIAAGALLLFQQGLGQTDNSVTPTSGIVQITTVPPQPTLAAALSPAATRTTIPPVPALLPASPAPHEGVWVRVNSTAHYAGSIGNPGMMQEISGAGDNFYKIHRSDRVVQVSIQKQDNSGALLSAGIYRDGTLIGSRSVTSPRGVVDLLIDPNTARPPGLTENDTLPEHAATPAGLENY